MKISPTVKQTIFSLPLLLNNVSIGMMYGYTAFLIPALLTEDGDDLKTDTYTASWIASITGISGIVAVLSVGPSMHYLGRRITQLIISTLMFIGWILNATATSIPMLMAGRAFQGIGTGILSFGSVYVAELTSPKIRGVVLSVKAITPSFGTLLVHILGCVLHWRYVAALAIVPIVIGTVITFLSPETPDFFISKGLYDEAQNVFFSIRGRDSNTEEEIKSVIETEKERTKSEHWKMNLRAVVAKLFSKVLLRVLVVLFFARVVIELGGKHYFSAYSVSLLKKMNINVEKGLLYTVYIDLFSMGASIVSVFLIKRFPRRLVIINCGYTATFLSIVGCLLIYVKDYAFDNQILLWIAVIMIICFFVIMYGATFGACFIVMGELIPLEFRSIGTVLEGLLGCILLTITLKTVPVLVELIEVHGMILVFSICILISLVYMHIDMPESKDRTLHDIAEYFKGNSPKNKTNKVSSL
ncbi:hypothetical protein JYU34_009822 [Plutella xylostella]|uniref:Major facilitator superfamily (MFS) profile domain-containing protein n=1 Tax=Plutella xylostella TaxID=51655 RepID=A0ABQ7QKF6_PLUXY|nr:hypothetical protein JYU34_009822 [Plutella xylostella]